MDYCSSKGEDEAAVKVAVASMQEFTTTTPAIAMSRPKFLGCFKDSWDRDLPQKVTGINAQRPGKCKYLCHLKGFKYSAVQAAYECWCGNAYGKHGKADNCQCDERKWAGEAWANCVYQ